MTTRLLEVGIFDHYQAHLLVSCIGWILLNPRRGGVLRTAVEVLPDVYTYIYKSWKVADCARE